jgi:hypothetical protein
VRDVVCALSYLIADIDAGVGITNIGIKVDSDHTPPTSRHVASR